MTSLPDALYEREISPNVARFRLLDAFVKVTESHEPAASRHLSLTISPKEPPTMPCSATESHACHPQTNSLLTLYSFLFSGSSFAGNPIVPTKRCLIQPIESTKSEFSQSSSIKTRILSHRFRHPVSQSPACLRTIIPISPNLGSLGIILVKQPMESTISNYPHFPDQFRTVPPLARKIPTHRCIMSGHRLAYLTFSPETFHPDPHTTHPTAGQNDRSMQGEGVLPCVAADIVSPHFSRSHSLAAPRPGESALRVWPPPLVPTPPAPRSPHL